ncbi:MAG: hypothetical protein OXE50_16285, partial [Chloroflexi bacterium]|nr:hypothetical protein [Chloroflexota bacterium]
MAQAQNQNPTTITQGQIIPGYEDQNNPGQLGPVVAAEHVGGFDAAVQALLSSGGTANQRVLRAVARQTSTSGVTSLQLPTDYADFQYVEMIVSDPGSGTNTNTAHTVRIETAWLAAQNDADSPKLAVLDTDEAGSRQYLIWTPSTRTFSRGVQTGQTVRLRIQSARLYDEGRGEKGDKGDPGDPGSGADATARAQIASLQTEIQSNDTDIARNATLIGANTTSLNEARAEVRVLQTPPAVDSRTGNYAMVLADRGKTLRHSGTGDATYSVPSSGVPNGWDVVVVNDSSGALVVNTGLQIIDEAGSSAGVGTREARRIQYLGAARWATIANTAEPDNAIDETARNDAADALTSVREQGARLDRQEQLTTDIGKVVESVSWTGAASTDAQFAFMTPASALGQKLANREAINPASDLPGTLTWLTDQNVPANNFTLVRIKLDVNPIQFRETGVQGDGVIHPDTRRFSDDTWDYYFGAGTGEDAARVVLQRK